MADEIHNVAALDRPNGRLMGTYSKKHPTSPEIDAGVTQRADVPVLATGVGSAPGKLSRWGDQHGPAAA